MGSYDPRLLVLRLRSLADEYSLFTRTASDTLNEAEYLQRCSRERVNQWIRQSDRIKDQVQRDFEAVTITQGRVRELTDLGRDAEADAHKTIERVTQAKQKANDTLGHWESELSAAIAWQQRAEAQLQQAIQARQRAEENLRAAQSRLSRAESSLNSCLSDSERKNCSSERSAYSSAQSDVSAAQRVLAEAIREVQRAEAELARAKARVSCCRNAVEQAAEAVQRAIAAISRANDALVHAERCVESAESAHKATANAERNAEEEQEVSGQLAAKVRQADQLINTALAAVRKARELADNAYVLSMRGTQELDRRVSFLVAFNKASFQQGGGVRGGGQSAAPVATRSEDAKINRFVQALVYKDLFNTLGSTDPKDSIRVEAQDADGKKIGFINVRTKSPNRVKIQDTEVEPQYRRRGIASRLFSQVERAFPAGTELYFEENQSPDFWSAKGFRKRKNADGVDEYFKIIE